MSVLGTYLARKFSVSPRATPRMDDNLPLRIKIGSIVNIEPTPFVIAKQAGLLVDQPDRQQIAAVGKIRYQGSFIYRYYFEDGKHLLQVVADAAGKITNNPFLYKLMPEIEPESEEVWSRWIADEDQKDKTGKITDTGFIGFKDFDLWDLAVDPPVQLASYARQWKKQLGPQAPLEEFNETFNVEPYEGKSMKVSHRVMMYSRKPPNPKAFPAGVDIPDEWLLASESTYPEKAVVQLSVGLPIAVETIDVVLS